MMYLRQRLIDDFDFTRISVSFSNRVRGCLYPYYNTKTAENQSAVSVFI